ncbi:MULTISPECIES: hypothetical protein [Planktothricoides]|nr:MULTISPECIES: hypothetical protein [Planktothricoides]
MGEAFRQVGAKHSGSQFNILISRGEWPFAHTLQCFAPTIEPDLV